MLKRVQIVCRPIVHINTSDYFPNSSWAFTSSKHCQFNTSVPTVFRRPFFWFHPLYREGSQVESILLLNNKVPEIGFFEEYNGQQ